MGAGDYDKRVTIQYLSAGSPDQSGSGEPDVAWATLATVYAAIEPLSGRELFAAQEHHSEVNYRIRIRKRSDVDAKMRVKYGTRYFATKYVFDKDEAGRETVMLCSEGVRDG